MNTSTSLFTKGATLALMVSLALASCQPVELTTPVSSTRSDANAKLSAGTDYIDGELIIQFAEGASDDVKQKALSKINGKSAEKILTKAMEKLGKKEGLTLVKVDKDVLQAVADLEKTEGVEFAEPNFIYKHAAVSSDSYFTNGSLWGMKSGFGSNAEAAWAANHTGSASVFVGVIDEGIQFDHPDLAGQVWTNPGDNTFDGVDNDNNGYVDDVHGWDFANNDNSIYDGGTGGTLDDHGTHVSGTIGAKANNSENGVGVVGVNWNVTLISAKFLGANGGSLANAIKAVDYLTNLKMGPKKLNIVASNNSWGGGSYSTALLQAIQRANNAGILFIAAAGNSGTNNDKRASYPSNYDVPNVIAVAAIDKNGALASFSQYGAKTVDLGAPGVGIWSTTAFKTYSSYNGTSMATPHVTGGAALYAAHHPGSTAAQIKSAILTSVVPTPSLSGKTVTGGRLNVSGF